ncbi:hypothetical protein LINPERHAP1_LOCUS43144 [Linum perenne]
MEEASAAPIRLMNFVSEEQLDEAKKTRGERVEDGTAQRDRPLHEILRENKDKKDAEFNERFKHRPPKALDEDETEFLDNLEMVSLETAVCYFWEVEGIQIRLYLLLIKLSRRELERQVADEEAEQLRSFQAAVAAQTTIAHEPEEKQPPPPVKQEQKPGKKNQPYRPNVIIKVKPPPAKKAKTEDHKSFADGEASRTPSMNGKLSDQVRNSTGDDVDKSSDVVAITGLVSYSDEESDEDDS